MTTGEAPTPRPTRHGGTDPSEKEKDGKRLRCSNGASDYGREHISRSSNSGPVWIYDQKLKRHRHQFRFSGRVIDIHGSAADRLRDELADVIRELLEWAAGEQYGGQFLEDGEAA